MNKRTGRRRDADRRHKLRLATIAGVFAVIIVGVLAVGWMLMRSTTATSGPSSSTMPWPAYGRRPQAGPETCG